MLSISTLSVAPNQVLMGIGRQHRHLGKCCIHFPLCLRDIVIEIGLMHLLAKVFKPLIGISGWMGLE
jgi:hypothetical protein